MIDSAATPIGTFREVYGKGSLEDRWILQCPGGCGIWAYLDADQWHGRVSVAHPEGSIANCDYHEIHDYYSALKEHLGREP